LSIFCPRRSLSTRATAGWSRALADRVPQSLYASGRRRGGAAPRRPRGGKIRRDRIRTEGSAMSQSLADRVCVPCKGGVPPLTPAEFTPLLGQLHGWDVADAKRLSRTYRFKNFAEAMAYANRVADIAEEQAHHPDLYVAWGKVGVEVWTHKIDGLTE